MARATPSCPAGPDAHTRCSTSAALGCPDADRYGGSTAAVTQQQGH